MYSTLDHDATLIDYLLLTKYWFSNIMNSFAQNILQVQ
jgi:hypothetical protein